jgi:hypothetical protein
LHWGEWRERERDSRRRGDGKEWKKEGKEKHKEKELRGDKHN